VELVAIEEASVVAVVPDWDADNNDPIPDRDDEDKEEDAIGCKAVLFVGPETPELSIPLCISLTAGNITPPGRTFASTVAPSCSVE
jgi:hypothetical protein